MLTVNEFELTDVGGGQLLGCTTNVEGALVWCTEVGVLQLVGCTIAALGTLLGFTTLVLAVAQFVVAGCTTILLGVLVWAEVGTLQLLRCTTAVLGALLGCDTVGLPQLVPEGNRPPEPRQFVGGFSPELA